MFTSGIGKMPSFFLLNAVISINGFSSSCLISKLGVYLLHDLVKFSSGLLADLVGECSSTFSNGTAMESNISAFLSLFLSAKCINSKCYV